MVVDCLAFAREQARRRLLAEFREGSAVALNEQAVYDLVFARFLLTHLPDPQAALSRMERRRCLAAR